MTKPSALIVLLFFSHALYAQPRPNACAVNSAAVESPYHFAREMMTCSREVVLRNGITRYFTFTGEFSRNQIVTVVPLRQNRFTLEFEDGSEENNFDNIFFEVSRISTKLFKGVARRPSDPAWLAANTVILREGKTYKVLDVFANYKKETVAEIQTEGQEPELIALNNAVFSFN